MLPRSLLAAFQFLTTLPIRSAFTAEEIGASLVWFPFVGIAIGGLVAAADLGAAQLGLPLPIRAVMAVGLLAALSGGLHLDGLADTADGFLSARSPEKVLEIMKDSRIGTMGALGLVLVVGTKFAALSDPLPASTRAAGLLLAPVFGRSLQVIGLTWMPYARPEGGMASVFLPFRSRGIGLFACLLPVVLTAILFSGSTTVVLPISAALLTMVWARSCLRTIGGMTGDTLGALSELGETLVLVIIASRAGGGIG